MGQAKKRGTLEQRKQAAIEKVLSLQPEFIVCNKCQGELTEIFPMDIRGMKGIEAAFGAHCYPCDHDTFALKGDPEAVADLVLAMEQSMGSEMRLGSVPAKG